MQPTPRPTRPTQQPQPQQPQPSTLAVSGDTLRRIGRDIWTLSIVETFYDARAFLRHPPRWFLIVCVAVTLFVIAFCTLSLTGAVASQAWWLRQHLPWNN